MARRAPALLLLLAALAACLGAASASWATKLHPPWVADGRSANYEVRINTYNIDPYDWDGVSTPATLNNFYATPSYWDKYWWRLEVAGGGCSQFDLTLTRLDTGAGDHARWSDCDMLVNMKTECGELYKWFFGGDLVMKWEKC